MLVFVILLILIVVLIAVNRSDEKKSHKRKNTYVFLYDEEGEIVDTFVDKSGMYRSAHEDEDGLDDFSCGVRLEDGSVMVDAEEGMD